MAGKRITIMPRKLYKYCSASEFSFQMLEKRQLYAASPLEFNDPFDCQIVADYNSSDDVYQVFFENWVEDLHPRRSKIDKAMLVKLMQSQRVSDPAFIRKLTQNALELLPKLLGVVCLSERSQCILMYSHYASKHAGFLVEFDTQYIDRTTWNIQKVHYSSKYPRLKILEASDDERTRAMILTKADVWSYEKEWRMIRYFREDRDSTVGFDERMLTRVVCGCNMSADHRERIRNALGQYSRAECFLARRDPAAFSMKYEQVEIHPRVT